MSSGCHRAVVAAHWGRIHSARIGCDLSWIGCDHDGCDAITSAPGDVSAIVDPAAADGWALTDGGDYCPAHADDG